MKQNFSPSYPNPPCPPSPSLPKNSRKNGEKESASSKKNITMKHKQWMPFDTACKDRRTSELSFISLHTDEATMKTWEPQRPSGVYKVFTKIGEGKKKSSLGQKLCKSYLNTYHETTGSRRTTGSRVEKRGKTQSILRIKSGNTVSYLGT